MTKQYKNMPERNLLGHYDTLSFTQLLESIEGEVLSSSAVIYGCGLVLWLTEQFVTEVCNHGHRNNVAIKPLAP